MSISTHVLDLSSGQPAAGVAVLAELSTGEGWEEVGSGLTDDDGRIGDLVEGAVVAGSYRMTFESGSYYASISVGGFYPRIVIHFDVGQPSDRLHVPLLISPYGYSTYRGS